MVGDLFCGDVLFSGGCGRLLGGTPEQMVDSLEKIRTLPPSTRIWCAHEYTLNNLEFALTFDRKNTDLQAYYQQVKLQRSQNQSTIPTILSQEIKINPFLRWDQPTIQKAMGNQDKVQVFATMRNRKNNY
jgi:hydroxyacylglutathione hydrolase